MFRATCPESQVRFISSRGGRQRKRTYAAPTNGGKQQIKKKRKKGKATGNGNENMLAMIRRAAADE